MFYFVFTSKNLEVKLEWTLGQRFLVSQEVKQGEQNALHATIAVPEKKAMTELPYRCVSSTGYSSHSRRPGNEGTVALLDISLSSLHFKSINSKSCHELILGYTT